MPGQAPRVAAIALLPILPVLSPLTWGITALGRRLLHLLRLPDAGEGLIRRVSRSELRAVLEEIDDETGMSRIESRLVQNILDFSRTTAEEVMTPRVDIANARLRFASGLIANLTASRVSVEKTRKFRVFAPRTYVSADFTAREAQVYRLEPDESGRPRIASARHGATDQEPLRLQIEAFALAVRQRSRPLVPGEDGRRALALAHAILERMAEA